MHVLLSCSCSMGSDNSTAWTEDILHVCASGWGMLSVGVLFRNMDFILCLTHSRSVCVCGVMAGGGG